eukprot:606500-Amphidinium_carterae.1
MTGLKSKTSHIASTGVAVRWFQSRPEDCVCCGHHGKQQIITNYSKAVPINYGRHGLSTMRNKSALKLPAFGVVFKDCQSEEMECAKDVWGMVGTACFLRVSQLHKQNSVLSFQKCAPQ